jgi:copper chaperone CopZ
MKNLLFSLMLLAAGPAFAQDHVAKLEIMTTSVCDMCEKTIETELIYEKGMKKVDLDLATGIIHVEYDDRKTTPDAIRTAVTKLGYGADGLPADEAAWSKLPDCCKKEGCGKPAKE